MERQYSRQRKGREDIITFKNMTMIEIVNIETGTTPRLLQRDKSWDNYERNRSFGRERPYDRQFIQ